MTISQITKLNHCGVWLDHVNQKFDHAYYNNNQIPVIELWLITEKNTSSHYKTLHKNMTSKQRDLKSVFIFPLNK